MVRIQQKKKAYSLKRGESEGRRRIRQYGIRGGGDVGRHDWSALTGREQGGKRICQVAWQWEWAQL